MCMYYPVSCPRECTENIPILMLNEGCPRLVVECDFKHAGCETKLRCKDMPVHASDPREMVCQMYVPAGLTEPIKGWARKLHS